MGPTGGAWGAPVLREEQEKARPQHIQEQRVTADACVLWVTGSRAGGVGGSRMYFRKSESVLILGAEKGVPTLTSGRGGRGHSS